MRWSAAILADSGVTDADTQRLGEGPDGYVVDRPMSPRAMLDPLALAFAFDAAEQDGVLRFRQRGGAPVAEIAEDDLVLPDDAAPARITRTQETDLPREVSHRLHRYRLRLSARRRRLRAAWSADRSRTAHADLAMVTE